MQPCPVCRTSELPRDRYARDRCLGHARREHECERELECASGQQHGGWARASAVGVGAHEFCGIKHGGLSRVCTGAGTSALNHHAAAFVHVRGAGSCTTPSRAARVSAAPKHVDGSLVGVRLDSFLGSFWCYVSD
jgi:hypothetical protein